MIDLNYKKHSLLIFNIEKCSVYFWYQEPEDEFYDKFCTDNEYFTVYDINLIDDKENDCFNYHKYNKGIYNNLTCEEVIIKNILE